jgi:hypothetical protein
METPTTLQFRSDQVPRVRILPVRQDTRGSPSAEIPAGDLSLPLVGGTEAQDLREFRPLAG